MKYTIEGFSQQRLIELKLDNTDALILRWFVDFLPRMATVEHEGKRYQWVKYQAVIDDLPCINITNREVISRRFNKFVESGIMTKYINKKDGVYTCYCLVNEYLTLVDGSTQKSIGIDSKVDTPIDSKVDTKDSSIKINSSIKSISESDDMPLKLDDIPFEVKPSNSNDDVITEIEQYFINAGGKKLTIKKETKADILKVAKEYSMDEIRIVIDFYSKDEHYIKNGYFNLVSLFRPTKFADKVARSSSANPNYQSNQPQVRDQVVEAFIDSVTGILCAYVREPLDWEHIQAMMMNQECKTPELINEQLAEWGSKLRYNDLKHYDAVEHSATKGRGMGIKRTLWSW